MPKPLVTALVTAITNVFSSKHYRWLRFKTHHLRRKCRPRSVAPHEYQGLRSALLKESRWNLNYIVLIITSCLIATFGLLSNSTAVIIGAMLIAPLMLPLRALSVATLEGDLWLFRQSFLSILGGTLLACGLSWFIGRGVGIPEFQSEVLSRTEPNLIDLGIAVSAGAVSSFAKIREGISDALAGTAIAVALMPPLCVVGLCLSQELWQEGTGALLLYLTNLLGITLACMAVFIFAGYAPVNRNALAGAIGLTTLLVIPLGARFVELVKQEQRRDKQDRLEKDIRRTLVEETITVGQGVEDTQIYVDWKSIPPTVYVILATDKAVTAKQAKLVENLLNSKTSIREFGQRFQLTFFVSKITRISPNDHNEAPKTNQSQPSPIVVPIPSEVFKQKRFQRYRDNPQWIPPQEQNRPDPKETPTVDPQPTETDESNQ